jgi:hypothetical protein
MTTPPAGLDPSKALDPNAPKSFPHLPQTSLRLSQDSLRLSQELRTLPGHLSKYRSHSWKTLDLHLIKDLIKKLRESPEAECYPTHFGEHHSGWETSPTHCGITSPPISSPSLLPSPAARSSLPPRLALPVPLLTCARPSSYGPGLLPKRCHCPIRSPSSLSPSVFG